MEWNFLAVLRDFDLLLLGLLNTLKVTGLALLFGVPLGLVLALLRLSTFRVLSGIAGFIVEFFRADQSRPLLGDAISATQWVAIGLALLGAALLFHGRRREAAVSAA